MPLPSPASESVTVNPKSPTPLATTAGYDINGCHSFIAPPNVTGLIVRLIGAPESKGMAIPS